MNRIKKMDNASESIRELREEIEAQCDALNGTLPKSGYKTVHKSEYVPYKEEPKTLMPIKVKLTKVHIIRR